MSEGCYANVFFVSVEMEFCRRLDQNIKMKWRATMNCGAKLSKKWLKTKWINLNVVISNYTLSINLLALVFEALKIEWFQREVSSPLLLRRRRVKDEKSEHCTWIHFPLTKQFQEYSICTGCSMAAAAAARICYLCFTLRLCILFLIWFNHIILSSILFIYLFLLTNPNCLFSVCFFSRTDEIFRFLSRSTNWIRYLR